MFSIALNFLASCLMASSLSLENAHFDYTHTSYFHIGTDSVAEHHFVAEQGHNYSILRGLKNIAAERSINGKIWSTMVPPYAANEEKVFVDASAFRIDFITENLVAARYFERKSRETNWSASDCEGCEYCKYFVFDVHTGEEVDVMEYFFVDPEAAREFLISHYEDLNPVEEEGLDTYGSMTASHKFYLTPDGIQLLRTETTFYTCDSDLDYDEFSMDFPFSDSDYGWDVRLIKDQ